METKEGYLLLVEDDTDILALLETTLEFKGYRVVTTQNGREALDAVRKEHPLIVIADIMMPHLDGFGLVHRLRIDPETRNIPVVFITAVYVAPEDRELALKIGVSRIIPKPVNIALFLETVDELLAVEPGTAIDLRSEQAFYEEYRLRLQKKLDQKVKHIVRDEHLLGSDAVADEQELQVSLRQSIRERDELSLLIERIDKQLERIGKAE